MTWLRIGRTKPFVGLLVVVMMLAVACQSAASPSSSGSAQPTATSSPPAVAGATPPPASGLPAGKKEIVIGGTLPLTGAYSAFGKYYQDAYNWWLSDVNSHGGILGLPVKMIIYDDTSNPGTAVSLYEKLITVDKVDLLIGGFSTPDVIPVMPIAEKYKMLFIQGGASGDSLIEQGHYQYTFTTSPHTAVWPAPFTNWVKSLPASERPKKFAFVQQVNPFLQDVTTSLRQQLQAAGIDTTDVQTYTSDTQDFTSMIQKFKADGVDALVSANNYPAAESIVRAVAQQQFKPKLFYLLVGPTVPTFLTDLGAQTNYVFSSTPYWYSLKTGNNAQFVQAIESTYHYTPTRDSGMAVIPLQILQQAVEATKSLNQDTLRNYVKTHEFQTLVGPLKFDSTNFANMNSYLIQVQGSKAVIVYPPDLKEADPVYPRP